MLVAGCGGDSRSHVAELVVADGVVEGGDGRSPEVWSAAAAGSTFAVGTAVRTGAASSARVRLVGGGGTLRMGGLAVIRFDRTGSLPRIALETGEAEIESGDEALMVDTEAGAARLRAGTRAVLTRDADGARLTVVVGMAEIERGDDAPLEVGPGTRVALTVAGVALVPVRPERDAGVATVDAAPAPSTPAARPTLRLGKREVELAADPGPVTAALALDGSIVVHDARPPTTLGLSVAGCDGATVLEVRKGRSRSYYRGDERVAVRLAAGRSLYRAYCVDGDVLRPTDQRGAIRVVRDDGRRRVKVRAPRNEVDADGRTYRLVFQNRMPTIVFRWPGAPAAKGYTLVIEGKGAAPRRHRTTEPTHTLRSGALGEGGYRWWFEAADGARSKASRLVLDFDNAAPVAQIDGATWSEETVDVRGLATVGSSVSADGVDLPVDRDYRFHARVPVRAGQRAVAIRIVRPGGAVHYYVQRAPARR